MEQTQRSWKDRLSWCGGKPSKAQIIWAVLFALALTANEFVRKSAGIDAYRWLLPVPVICGIFYVIHVVKDMARIDEMQQRIYLEAAAATCLGLFLLGLLHPTFERAGLIGPLEGIHVSIAVGLLVTVGFFVSAWRYR